eukprot:m.66085 g.66085  ORF g.66085 m.66085 type:complete len:280 (+) comp11549_c0_seq1:119-958(+)
MDLVLQACDDHVLTPFVYPESVPEGSWWRQLLSLWAISGIGGFLLYFSCASLAWIFCFDKKLRQHDKFYKNQELLEIISSAKAIPTMSFLTALCFLAEVRGYSQLYDDHNEYGGVNFLVFTFIAFIVFTDFGIYWAHRWLHLPSIYPLHKPHHKWKVPTPFASHAFHPLDGFAQSLSYHIYVFLFPMHKLLYLALFVIVNIWSVGIHDEFFILPKFLQPIINGAAHHTDHHVHTYFNYGQYFTLWDRIGGSYRHPDAFCGKGVHKDVADKLAKEEKKGK